MHTSWIFWSLLAAGSAAALVAIVRTKWLQSHTLQKCVVLSLVLHAVAAIICGFLGGKPPASWGQQAAGPMTMLVVMAQEPSDDQSPADAAPPLSPLSKEPLPDEITPDSVAVASAVPEIVLPPADHVPLLEVADAEMPERADLADATAAALESLADTDSSPAPPAADAAVVAGPSPARYPAARYPAVYADRAEGHRAAAAAARGGSQETEQAVQAALSWLAAAQSSDGRWNAVRHGGGVHRAGQGQHRQGAGGRSDHGVTGLALLAFLGAGNTHRSGPYAETVARGICFLTDHQRPDGSLAGDAEFFAALYCHGMAAIAVAECSAMTGDSALRSPLEKAVGYTLSMQSPATGGWRYAAGDKGDTSQLGWQVMLLASARQAGLTGLEPAEARAGTFLQSVSSGRAGGLAAYRSGERPTAAMTAEALACRLFLGMPVDHPAVAEAVDLLAKAPPDARNPNAYAWYYASLASFHAGGPQWEKWNQQLQAALLPLQRRDSSDSSGSWDPDPVWGDHGGRVYSTSLAALTLEVYYRYLPLHRQPTAVARVPIDLRR